MVAEVFGAVEQSAALMGAEPLWLKDRVAPKFDTVEKGSAGPPMVLLHGLFGALSNWESSLPLFSKYTKSIALSFPIFSAHRSEVRVKSLACYTEYLIRDRKLSPAVLCGNSLGGHVALRLCLARPELVDCLVLSGTSGLYEHNPDTLPVRPDRKFLREHAARVFHQEKFITDALLDEILAILANRKNHLNLIHAARSAKKDNLQNLLPLIKVPTLLLWGEEDQVTTMQVAETFHRLIPNSQLVTKKGCGHAPMIEYPEWFSEQVHTFLKKHSKTPVP